MFKYEGLNYKILRKFGVMKPYCNHLFTLSFDDGKCTKSSKPIEDCMKSENCFYILEFIVPTS